MTIYWIRSFRRNDRFYRSITVSALKYSGRPRGVAGPTLYIVLRDAYCVLYIAKRIYGLFQRSIFSWIRSQFQLPGSGKSILARSCSVVGVFEGTPLAGTSRPVIQTRPLRTTFRKSLCPQLIWLCPPVKPKPRPPPGRSYAQARCSGIPIRARTYLLPL